MRDTPLYSTSRQAAEARCRSENPESLACPIEANLGRHGTDRPSASEPDGHAGARAGGGDGMPRPSSFARTVGMIESEVQFVREPPGKSRANLGEGPWFGSPECRTSAISARRAEHA